MGSLITFPAKDDAAAHMSAVAALPILETRFPHVCAHLANLWHSPEVETYLQSLIVDEGLERQGFPPEAFDELNFLSDLAFMLHHGQASRGEVEDPEIHGLGINLHTQEYSPEEDPYTLPWTPTRA